MTREESARHGRSLTHFHLVLQSQLGDKPLGIRVLCPQNGTAVLKGLNDPCACTGDWELVTATASGPGADTSFTYDVIDTSTYSVYRTVNRSEIFYWIPEDTPVQIGFGETCESVRPSLIYLYLVFSCEIDRGKRAPITPPAPRVVFCARCKQHLPDR